MNEKYINIKTKRQIFDGNEDKFRIFKEEILIPNTDEKVIYKNALAIPIWKLDENIRKKIAKEIAGIDIIEYKFDPIPSYKHDNLDIYTQETTTKKSNKKVTIVTAAGETQPARYKVKLLGLILN
ncbi:hypothetical protein [Serratia ficaria]|uniref:hypothetical protein n=1 Tax=Serratia ficaria TaxID=61651 RepID=UPI0021BDA041|nr:hypothetical protein [Serratia ficaria]